MQFLFAALASYIAVSAAAINCCGDEACSGKRRDAEAGSQREFQVSAGMKIMLRNLLAHAFGHRAGKFDLVSGKHDYKLVAAIASHRVSVAN